MNCAGCNYEFFDEFDLVHTVIDGDGAETPGLCESCAESVKDGAADESAVFTLMERVDGKPCDGLRYSADDELKELLRQVYGPIGG